MSSAFLLVIGVVGVVGGVVMTLFNKQVAAAILPRFKGKLDLWDAIFATKAYQPTSSGRVPILMVIGVGWILIGAMLILVSVTGA